MTRAIGLQTRVVVAVNQVAAELSDELVILNLDQGEYYGLNSVGSKIWNLIQQPRTVAEVRDHLLADYPDVDPVQCADDTIALLTDLLDAGLIEVVEDPSQ